jgi:hypothetical protein
MNDDERWKRFRVEQYVIADGRTPEQIERDQRLLAEVRRMAQARHERGPVARMNVEQRVATQTYEQALRGKEHLDYLPREACKICGRPPFWNGFTYDDNHDREAHRTDERNELERALDRLNGGIQRITDEDVARVRLVRSDDDD